MRLSEVGRSSIRSLARNHPKIRRLAHSADITIGLAQHTLAQFLPHVVRARPRKLTVAITAHCNLRCIGCRYGRDFMSGHQLPLSVVKTLLDDAKAAGIETARIYGGEPLLHPDLPAIVRHAVNTGLSTYITTNGLLLKQRIGALFDAGLRSITIGFYGTLSDYDDYVQRAGRYRRLEESIAIVRKQYGSSISLKLNYLLMRPSCTIRALHNAWDLVRLYDLQLSIDLIHYSLPYFTEGPDSTLQFREEDRASLMDFVAELARLKASDPDRIRESLMSIYSIPDWVLKGPAMRVPCDAHKLIWVGADGTVQLCYVTFRLGNLYERRLKDMLFTDAHTHAAQDAFALNCPNCHCERDSRIQKHLQSRRRYRGPNMAV